MAHFCACAGERCAGAWGALVVAWRATRGRVWGGPGLEAFGVIGVTAVLALLKGGVFPRPPFSFPFPLQEGSASYPVCSSG